MAQPSLQLPSEVWVHVFGYLSATDKFNIRACCRYFKKLVDHGSLWKDYTVVLSFKNVSYNPQFWATLRRRKIDSVVLRSTKAKDWKQLPLSLPTLTTLVIDQPAQDNLTSDLLKNFTNLKRLAIRIKSTSLRTVPRPEQLTHLSVCDVSLISPTQDAFISTVSQFTNLTYLSYHQKGNNGALGQMFDFIVGCLPKLKHLSLSMHLSHPMLHEMYRNGRPGSSGGTGVRAGRPALSHLELVDYMDPSLLKDAMRSLPCLQSLAVFYKQSHSELNVNYGHDVRTLRTWLSDLHQLSTLVIAKGPPLREYASSIPATVTSLTLRVGGSISSEDMAAVAAQVPNLLHLHVDPWPSFLGVCTGQIPELFPKLRSLKLRHEHVLKKDLLGLRRLQNLRYLEILDAHPGPRPYLSELIHELQALTHCRIQVVTSPRQRDPLPCLCTGQVY